NLRVIAPHVGGGFGQKMASYPEDVVIAFLAKTFGRPIKWIEDRRENLLAAMHSKEQVIEIEAALDDDAHADEQHARYAARRALLRSALEKAGFRVDHSEASLYLWSSRDEDCWDTVSWLADRGILVAPGSFYGAAGSRHVRVAFTATDERVAAAVARLAAS
ncbi:aminotransferase class I/II-fold pyridoxal phosphate-dependent enzyme, partial [Aeromicrobium sp. REDSEA-S32_B7]|uniref:aminotransferase class I/II-fold pyridoxal phosphate-dependent enzyme n=1 Tax=Aeromicrobium sp. REDSEA-S32_B7 TaxID=1811526 RepID=UPI000A902F76